MQLTMRVINVGNSRGAVLFWLVLLAGCVNHNHAPVRDLEKPVKVTSGSHRVVKGETLYSIAWRYGWDYKVLAKANNIKKPYLLKPGQVIYLNRTTAKAQRSRTAVSKNKVSNASRQSTTSSRTKKRPGSGRLNWHWPANGPLTQTFSRWGESKGIDIAVKGRSVVRSAADGVVVYAGSGLIGYWNLIIIKHNDIYLSAYANNKRILVKEQRNVKAGEIIAEIESRGARKASLHFEIRKNGKPVDPLIYLPKSRS